MRSRFTCILILAFLLFSCSLRRASSAESSKSPHAGVYPDASVFPAPIAWTEDEIVAAERKTFLGVFKDYMDMAGSITYRQVAWYHYSLGMPPGRFYNQRLGMSRGSAIDKARQVRDNFEKTIPSNLIDAGMQPLNTLDSFVDFHRAMRNELQRHLDSMENLDSAAANFPLLRPIELYRVGDASHSANCVIQENVSDSIVSWSQESLTKLRILFRMARFSAVSPARVLETDGVGLAYPTFNQMLSIPKRYFDERGVEKDLRTLVINGEEQVFDTSYDARLVSALGAAQYIGASLVAFLGPLPPETELGARRRWGSRFLRVQTFLAEAAQAETIQETLAVLHGDYGIPYYGIEVLKPDHDLMSHWMDWPQTFELLGPSKNVRFEFLDYWPDAPDTVRRIKPMIQHVLDEDRYNTDEVSASLGLIAEEIKETFKRLRQQQIGNYKVAAQRRTPTISAGWLLSVLNEEKQDWKTADKEKAKEFIAWFSLSLGTGSADAELRDAIGLLTQRYGTVAIESEEARERFPFVQATTDFKKHILNTKNWEYKVTEANLQSFPSNRFVDSLIQIQRGHDAQFPAFELKSRNLTRTIIPPEKLEREFRSWLQSLGFLKD